jgi:hypothetical protein
MQYKNIFTIALIAFSLISCKAQTAADDQAQEKAPALQPEKPMNDTKPQVGGADNLSAAQVLEKKFTKEMPYADLRKIVLADGWLPLVEPDCKENVGGEALICGQQPETESCSGDGHCNMWFAHGASQTKLKVGTYGDNTKFWEFSSALSDAKTVACPSQKFEDFLKKFASDKAVEAAFTLPLVKVEELALSKNGDLDTKEIYTNKADYKDFDLIYKSDGFHVLDSDDKADPKATPLEIKLENADTYFVKYLYGMSEGNSYRFQSRAGCWYLAEDPDAPSP